MNGLSRLNSANHLSAAAAAVYPKRLLRTSIGHSSPAATAGISDTRNSYARKRGKKLKELSRSVVMLTCDSSADGGVCNVYLVGSNHHCPKYWEEVRATVQFLKPEVVFLELCSKRNGILMRKNPKVPTMREMAEMWKQNHKLSWILYYWCMTKRGSRFEHTICGDFRAANEEAKKYGAKVILGDRPIHLNGKYDAHAWDQYHQETAKSDPAWAEIYGHERDQYISAKILDVARDHKSVVAVVGKAHLPGIQKNWKQPVDVEQLLSIPTQKKTVSMGKILPITGVAMIYGIYLSIKLS
ncbi:uncharacterized protein LOC131017320 isoform X2 [Salvia miltiorrhiza]|uniref:uncharacterized protein LOC131017320 isoform X2 n=1 Tax=Salvia miltiorrhiza TaxID=226208 RepID=UPI0025ABC906|nr:uncharacterized protein LOC131017320 isoform X2 [Salvia miltiorrhiza]